MPANHIDLTGRDRLVVQLIARFRQASSRQVHELLFPGVTYTPADRALRRLTERGFLTRIERRTVGGSRGGSGQYCYGLGRRGFYMHFDGRFNPPRSVNYHALAVLDTYIALRRLQLAGKLEVVGLSTEPDCWSNIGGDELKPDLYVELSRTTGGLLRLWLEVDMATEGQRQIKDKLARYWRAYNAADMDEFPLVVWVAVDDERAKELRWIIEQLPKDARPLFRVRTLANFGDAFAG